MHYFALILRNLLALGLLLTLVSLSCSQVGHFDSVERLFALVTGLITSYASRHCDTLSMWRADQPIASYRHYTRDQLFALRQLSTTDLDVTSPFIHLGIQRRTSYGRSLRFRGHVTSISNHVTTTSSAMSTLLLLKSIEVSTATIGMWTGFCLKCHRVMMSFSCRFVVEPPRALRRT